MILFWQIRDRPFWPFRRRFPPYISLPYIQASLTHGHIAPPARTHSPTCTRCFACGGTPDRCIQPGACVRTCCIFLCVCMCMCKRMCKRMRMCGYSSVHACRAAACACHAATARGAHAHGHQAHHQLTTHGPCRLGGNQLAFNPGVSPAYAGRAEPPTSRTLPCWASTGHAARRRAGCWPLATRAVWTTRCCYITVTLPLLYRYITVTFP